MTLKEAHIAARRGFPVIYDGAEYVRIASVGYTYDDRGNSFPFVQIVSKSGNSVTQVKPEQCTLASEFYELIVREEQNFREKE